ncbi:unnamed protein product [Rhizoctonia solani]|uniref:Uncharacterized protein n=1 Tax=Rhizoctonia solani TaxID=456999 RepID=A0A8H3D821_9AGAM|nr:unnamed protein product [Rhizoctonia solani]
MPSFAGYFATQGDCREWLRENEPEVFEKIPRASTRPVERRAKEFMKAKRVGNAFFLEILPLPGPPVPGGPWALMLVCRYSERKKYLAPKGERDNLIRDLIMSEFKLKVSDWSVLWYSKHDPELVSEYLSPETESSDDE